MYNTGTCIKTWEREIMVCTKLVFQINLLWPNISPLELSHGSPFEPDKAKGRKH